MSGTATNTRNDEVVLRTKALTKRYGDRTAVNGLTLDVHRGDIFGFLGPNGAGKTTTIRMALGLITPTAGSVEILGHDIATESKLVLPRVGALVETPALYLYMNARDNLRAVASDFGQINEQRIDTVLDLVGLTARQRDRVRTFSLGMKQRLGVGLALLSDPDILILDEPANGLDPAGIVEIRDLMRNLSAAGKTVFISSHVLGEVQQICTRIAILNLGKLVTESTVEELTRGTGQGRFTVYVERAPEALALVQAQPWGRDAHLDASGALISTTPDGKGRSLNSFLVNAGFVPDGLYFQQESLEQVFLRLTGSPTEGVH